MNGINQRSIALLIGAVVLLAFGGFAWSTGHVKTGIGILAVGVIVVGISLVSVFVARSSS